MHPVCSDSPPGLSEAEMALFAEIAKHPTLSPSLQVALLKPLIGVRLQRPPGESGAVQVEGGAADVIGALFRRLTHEQNGFEDAPGEDADSLGDALSEALEFLIHATVTQVLATSSGEQVCGAGREAHSRLRVATT